MLAWWADLGQPVLTPELQQRLVEGVLAEAGARDLPSLARERDEELMAVMAARRSGHGCAPLA